MNNDKYIPAELDTSNVGKHKIAFLILLIIVIVLIVIAKRNVVTDLKGTGEYREKHDGNGNAYYMGRGHSRESIEVLLDRIEWSTYLNSRISVIWRFFIITIIIMLFVVIVVMQKVPTPAKMILLFLAIFIPMFATHQLFYMHGDVYNDYYIKNNVQLLREKLDIPHKKDKKLKEPTKKLPNRTVVLEA